MFSNAALIIALGAALAHAQQTMDFSSTNCPDGWSLNGGNGNSDAYYCCPGSGVYIADSIEGCAIGSTTVSRQDPNYTSIVSSLYAAESGGETSPATGVDTTPTESSSAAMSTGSEDSSTTGTMSESSGSAGAAESATSSTSQGGAQAMVTAAPLLGAAALALMAL